VGGPSRTVLRRWVGEATGASAIVGLLVHGGAASAGELHRPAEARGERAVSAEGTEDGFCGIPAGGGRGARRERGAAVRKQKRWEVLGGGPLVSGQWVTMTPVGGRGVEALLRVKASRQTREVSAFPARLLPGPPLVCPLPVSP
jgi:hypothetical protein